MPPDDTGATPGSDATSDKSGKPEGATPAAPKRDDDDLGDSGRETLRKIRAELREAASRAEAAEKERDELRSGSQTEHDRALNQTRREAATEERQKWTARIRTAEVRGALRAAGIVSEKFLTLAMAASEFSNLKVDEDGNVEGVEAAVATFREDYPEAFGSRKASDDEGASKDANDTGRAAGPWGGSEGGTRQSLKPMDMESAVGDFYRAKPKGGSVQH